MNLFPGKQECNKYSVHTMVTRLLFIYVLTFSTSSFAGAPPPSENQCKSKWTVASANGTAGLQFGDFTLESGSGTIVLNGGTARTAGGSVDLVSAGSGVNSHFISINNTRDPVICPTFGITLDWNTDPTVTPMFGNGNDITMSNVLVHVPGEAGTPFTTTDLPHTFVPASLPLIIEITAQMNVASFPQLSGSYVSLMSYDIGITQGGTNTSATGNANTFSITPLTLTAGVSMNFGQIASGSSGGTIVLNEASGARSVGSGDADVINDASAGTPGGFTLMGDAGLAYSISYSNGSLTNSAGGNAMSISGFTDTTAALTLSGGADPFTVGATITLSGSQPAGNYSTANPGGQPYKITVNYN